MTIHWDSFLIVAVVTWAASLFIVGAYSLGVRLLAVGEDSRGAEAKGSPLPARAAAYGCFAMCGIVVLFGIILIVPALSERILGA
ncbi:MAG: hypothetical protein ABWX63_08865 [Paeniglutamicibacter terrestris]|uniref:Uncharacterized protein n=1 Tax=Paeniglutamicibacter terrestris TaxID=2723403 RepID=A0ABX1G3U4_9MICC|nr:hypothetical protein [Paeniglutamicibacter terrestris]ASN39089.1 hypothetical protein CGQ24_08725 [Arthrobacter sp. 7749]NKG20634.1 hypothetical protein [Paeniglutamicibacter terrestris]